ncbi:MAG: diguanylate cyclase [Sulfuricurvum sp.]|uniref:sensor domain-containing diguanylate cyclase n=1 Tax=Sulfuricurvum sp. TaxID=2025608 RepID=UPI002615DC1D|nr:sensor domain-containing diguanylate cyclase [Sulfuricurvum sp.]MDD2830033.1 diguanylate cyclase [Sulfuricurvum sp.]MDD4948354.1 diguanylate cyclase [Sulfuricurvum sp.]
MIFLNRLNEWPIQKKLIYSHMLGIFLAFLPVFLVMVVYEYYALRNAVLHEIRVQAEIIGESSAAAMAFSDKESAFETLASLNGSEDMIAAYLILPNGGLFESFYYSKKAKPPYLKSLNTPVMYNEHFSFSEVTIVKPIYLRTEYVGSLTLVSGLNSFYTRLSFFWILILSVALFGFVLARYVASKISHTITEPLMHLIAVAQKVTSVQDYNASISIDSKDEVGKLSKAFGEMMSQIHKRDLSMQQLAYYDRVSGIANRHYFEERIVQAVGNAERYGTVCYLLMIDLDDFKIVNDSMGHDVGDMLLRHVSESIIHTLRQNDFIFRIGGDEFAVIIESTSNLESIEQIAQKVIFAVSTPVALEGQYVKVGASIGVSCFPKHAHDVRSLIRTADEAMYEAKNNGKNNFQIYRG